MIFIKYTADASGKIKEMPYKFVNAEEKTKYIYICEIIWGCVPVDVDWATSTGIYQQAAKSK